MGKDIGPEEREANPGNGATVRISGELVPSPEGVPDFARAKHGVQ